MNKEDRDIVISIVTRAFEVYHLWHDEEADISVWFLERKLKPKS